MLDLVGTVVLFAAITLNVAAFVGSLDVSLDRRLSLAGIAGLWFGLAAALGGAGVFANAGAQAFPLVGVMVVTPLLLAAVLAWTSAPARAAISSSSLPLLIGLNSVRVLGGFFLILAAQDRLAGPFPYFAGWGDVLTGAFALPVALLATRDPLGHARTILAWNAFGMLDLLVAVGLGVASANGSPVQVIFAGVGSAAVQSLPWVLIPSVLVPFYLILHGIIFSRLMLRTRVPALGRAGRA